MLLAFALQVGCVRFVMSVLELIVSHSIVSHSKDFHGLRQEFVGIGADELLDLVGHVFLSLREWSHVHIHVEDTARLTALWT